MKKLLYLLPAILFLLPVKAKAQTQIAGLAADPATCDPSRGLIYYNTTTQKYRYCSALNTWSDFGGSGTIGGSISAGEMAYGASSDAIAGSTVRIDMAGVAGADLGAKMNACVALLPSNTGICDGSSLTGALTLSTAVTPTTPVTFYFCGQQVTQTAEITLSVGASAVPGGSLMGCSQVSTLFIKGGNLAYQVILSGLSQTVQYITFDGAKGSSYTGSGIHVDGNSYNCSILNNVVQQEASDDIDNDGAYNLISSNALFGWGVSAYVDTALSWFSKNNVQDLDNPSDQGPNTSSGAALNLNGSTTYLEANGVTDAGPVGAVTASGTLTIVNNVPITQTNGYPSLIFTTGEMTASGNDFAGGGANGPAVSSVIAGTITFTENQVSVTGGDAMDFNAQFAAITGNHFTIDPSGTTGLAALNFTGSSNNISGNFFTFSNGESPTGDNYLIHLNTSLGGSMLDGNTIRSNQLTGTTNAHDVGFYLDVTVAAVVEQNHFDFNICRDVNRCILRYYPTSPETNYFSGNEAVAANYLFATGGTPSTGDIITNTGAPVYPGDGFTYSTLPAAGSGSQVWCQDCTQTTPLAGSGSGAEVFNVGGTWYAIGTAEGTSAPSVLAAGCGGTGASIATNKGTLAFKVNVGTSNTGVCTITMPTATTDWLCSATDITTISTTVSQTRSVPTSGSLTTEITLSNYTDISGAHAWTDSDVIAVTCHSE